MINRIESNSNLSAAFTRTFLWLTGSIIFNCTIGCAVETSLLLPSDKIEFTNSDHREEFSEKKVTNFNVLSWNLYLRPAALFANGQMTRARLIAEYVANYDAVIFSEAFDDRARAALIKTLTVRFPYHTFVVGSDKLFRQDGGVFIMSRYPIEFETQITFGSASSGTDRMADKGVIYARINKYGSRFHVFGTHTQAHTSESDIRARKAQFSMIRDFVTAQNIPAGEAVLIGGDLNVDRIKYQAEYESMLNILEAAHPERLGFLYSYDHRTNGLATEKAQEYLDYVLYSLRHRRPSASTNEVLFLKTSRAWKESDMESECLDLSDHYPLLGCFTFEEAAPMTGYTASAHN